MATHTTQKTVVGALALFGIGYALNKLKNRANSGFGRVDQPWPNADFKSWENGNPDWADDGNSWSYLKLSPDFAWHEKPIRPQPDYTDLAKGEYGVISDPYYNIDYNYATGVDYYREQYIATPIDAVSPAYSNPDPTSFGPNFIGPAKSVWSNVVKAKENLDNFVNGVN